MFNNLCKNTSYLVYKKFTNLRVQENKFSVVKTNGFDPTES